MKLNRLLLLSVLTLSSLQATPLENPVFERVKRANEGSESYYLVGDFSSYQVQEEYKFKKNYNSLKHEEYQLTLSLEANSSFYVSNSDASKTYKRPDGQEFLVSEKGEYEFKFSPTYDYGNSYHLHYVKKTPTPQASTYQVNTKEDLLALIKLCQSDVNSKNLTVELNSDLDLEGTTISPIAIFNGYFKGNNHTIKNFKIDHSLSGNEAGFIRKLTSKGKVEGLHLAYDGQITHDDTLLGGLVGVNEGEVVSCSYRGSLVGNNVVGGLVGSNKEGAKISSCLNFGSLEGKIITGGICGNNKGEIISCVNQGSINQNRFSSLDEMLISNIGGIVGFNHGSIQESINQGKVGVKQIGNFIGGISGSSIGEITSCVNKECVEGNSSVGGIVGQFAELKERKNDDAYNNLISVIQKIIDGLEGKKQMVETSEISAFPSQINYCYNVASISGDSNVGGICGYASNEKNISGDIHNFSVSKCLNQGKIKGNKNNVGGVVGNHIIGEIDSSFNDGLIEASNADYVGGIVGSSSGRVVNCFSSGELIGNNYVGGIGGSNSTLKDCYNLTSIKCKGSFAGSLSGFIANVDKNVAHNYYVNSDYNGIDNVDYLDCSTKVERSFLASKAMLKVNLNPESWLVSNKVTSYPMIRALYEMELDTEAKKYIHRVLEEDTKFGCYVAFIDGEDKIIKKVFVEYGKDLDQDLIPSVPKKDGYFATWEDFDSRNIEHNIFVKVVYEQIITSLATESGPKPQLIVEGKFNDQTKVNLLSFDENMLEKNSQYTYRGTFKVNLEGMEGNLPIKIKYRLPDKISSPSIKALKDGSLIDVETTIEGNYICFEGKENQEYVLLEKSFCNWNNPSFILTISFSVFGGVLLIGGLTYLIIKKSKKSKKLHHAKK